MDIKYLIISDQDEGWGLTVSTVGFQHIAPNFTYPPQNHPAKYLFSVSNGRILDEFVLLYIARGMGLFSSSLQRNVKVKAGTMILLFPGEWHSYQPEESSGWDEYWIGFKGKHINDRVDHLFFTKQNQLFNAGFSMEIVRLYKNAIDVAVEQRSGYQQILSGIVNLILGITYSENKNSMFETNNITQQVNKAKIIMFENSHTNMKAEEIADQLCMSYSWFRYIFKQHTGLSPHQYIQELRIHKGKELLVTTSQTCQEIAFKVGYENPIHFGALFKKKTGYSPREYRNKHILDLNH